MPSAINIYSQSKIKAAVAPRPFLSLVALAASVLETGNDAKILDLQLSKDPFKEIRNSLVDYRPTIIGLSFTTPLYPEAKKIAQFIKESYPEVKIISGGVHTSIMPEQVLNETDIDIAVIGEGDITIKEIVQDLPLTSIKGIAFRDKKDKTKIIKTPPRPLVQDLDSLPMPAWHLLSIKSYKNPRMMARKNPVATIETSRGCVFGCTYCNKSVFGRTFRFKSVKRVVDEFEHLKKLGFGEIHVWDDMFSTNMPRAKAICDEIINRKIKIPWQLDCGVRVNCVDQEFFYKLKKAGCYKVAFGYESGNNQVLKNVHKEATIEQAFEATKMAKKAKLEVVGFFMLGLPGETVETMNDTINYAIKLDIDYAKATILVPYPSTEIYCEWKQQGHIKSEDWGRYNDHSPSKVYDHPALDWETLGKYYDLFYKKFYIRPRYISKKLVKDTLNGTLLYDAYYAIKTFI